MESLFKEEKVNPKKFVGFVLPSIIMMVVLSCYYTIDAILVANYAGEKALAALSISYPVMGLLLGISVMFAAGSSAIVAMNLGMKKDREASEKFTLICIVAGIVSILLIFLGQLFMDQIISFLGAEGELKELCSTYIKILIWSIPGTFMSIIFEYYIRVDGRPGLTLALYLIGGGVHIASAWILMGAFGWGIEGAALGTVIGMIVSTALGGAYFWGGFSKLKFVKPKMDGHYIGHSMVNGSSELVSEASDGIMTLAFNLIMLKYAGESGVAALSIVLSIHYCLISIHIGYIIGLAPLISYYYGAKEYKKVNTFLRYSRNYIIITALALTVICFFGAPWIVEVFVDKGSQVYDMAILGMKLIAPSFLLVGLTIFASGFFTAYGNGQISAIISLSRGLIFVIGFAVILSNFMGATGLWLAPMAAEVVTGVIAIIVFRKYRDKYNYRFML